MNSSYFSHNPPLSARGGGGGGTQPGKRPPAPLLTSSTNNFVNLKNPLLSCKSVSGSFSATAGNPLRYHIKSYLYRQMKEEENLRHCEQLISELQNDLLPPPAGFLTSRARQGSGNRRQQSNCSAQGLMNANPSQMVKGGGSVSSLRVGSII